MNFKPLKAIIVWCLSAILLAGCSPVMRLIYGIKKPRFENQQTLVSYLQRTEISVEDVYTLNFEGYLNALELINKRVPEVLIFDRDGNYIPYGDEWACNAGAFGFIENLNDTTFYLSTDRAHLDGLPFSLHTLAGDSLGMPPTAADFHVFVFWAKFTGRLNKNHVKVWENQATQNIATNVRLYKINLDFQEHWSPEIRAAFEAK